MTTKLERDASIGGRFNIVPIESVIYGPGSLDSLGSECDRLGVNRVLVITSPSLSRLVDTKELIGSIIGSKLVGVFTDCKPHVPDTTVMEAVRYAKDLNIDAVVSVGGGSPIDLAKALVMCLSENINTREGLDAYRVKFEYPDKVEIPSLKGKAVPHIAISTTLSAGEFTTIIGITDTVRKVKELYIDNALIPRVVIHDPVLAIHTPRDLWASTGMRSVDHAIEALCSTSAQPITDVLCIDALTRLTKFLPPSVADAQDYASASQCQMGAWESILGLTNVTLGLSHGIGHQLGARNGVPHGVTSCVMLPTVLAFNKEFTLNAQQVISTILSEAVPGSTPKTDASELLRAFITSLGLPTRLRDVGVKPEDFPLIARDAMADMIVASNPRPIEGEKQVIEILQMAY
jgi:alcohol dehydrogenase class IV